MKVNWREIGKKERKKERTNKGNDKQEEADSLLHLHNVLYFKILLAVNPEKF